MPKKKYTAEFKTKVILTIIQGDKEFNAICADFNLNPSMVRKWKQEFLQNAHRAFVSDSEQKSGSEKGGPPEEKERPDAKNHRAAHAGTRFPSGLLSPNWRSSPKPHGL